MGVLGEPQGGSSRRFLHHALLVAPWLALALALALAASACPPASVVGVVLAVLLAGCATCGWPRPGRRAGPLLRAAGLAAFDTVGWMLEARDRLRRAVAERATVWCDPFGLSARLIELRPPVSAPLGRGRTLVTAVRVASTDPQNDRALRAVAWLYREFPEADGRDWARCAAIAGLAAPPAHVLELFAAGVSGRESLGLQVYVQPAGTDRVLVLRRGARTLLGQTRGPAPIGGLTAHSIVRDALASAAGALASETKPRPPRRRAD
jgi:hypothetical protein